jgi:hypothetical protein
MFQNHLKNFFSNHSNDKNRIKNSINIIENCIRMYRQIGSRKFFAFYHDLKKIPKRILTIR